jgi:glutathione S-transferase
MARDDFTAHNPLAQVSTLILPDGTILTETSACLMWVQTHSQNPDFKRTPDHADYFQMLRWIGFCATELHKQLLRIVFYDEATEDVKDNFRHLSLSRLELLNNHLEGRSALIGDTYSAADAYLIWFLTLAPKAGVKFTPFGALSAYFDSAQSDESLQYLLTEDAKRRASLKA